MGIGVFELEYCGIFLRFSWWLFFGANLIMFLNFFGSHFLLISYTLFHSRRYIRSFSFVYSVTVISACRVSIVFFFLVQFSG
jgi:hypothetical protein